MIYVIDTETTGRSPAEVIELCVLQLLPQPEATFKELEPEVSRFCPKETIAYGALAVHHILLDELKDCPPSASAKLPQDAKFIIGHNVDYDWEALGKPEVKRICTLAIARAVWEDQDGHSLGACLYRILPHAQARETLKQAHAAKADVLNCAVLLEYFCQTVIKPKSMNELWAYSEAARIPKKWTFGKYFGKEIAKTERGYLNWCLGQATMDQYVKLACKKALGLA